KLVEQRTLKYRAELCVAQERADFRKGNWVGSLDTKALQQFGIEIGSLDAHLYRPVRPSRPIRPNERDGAEFLADRGYRFEEAAHLASSLPIVADVRDAVFLRGGPARRFGRGIEGVHDAARVVTVKKERLYIPAPGLERRLQDLIGYRLKRLDPFPALVAVHLFEMIEVMLDANRFVVAARAIDDHPTTLRHAVKQAGEIGQIRKVRCNIDDEESNVEVVHVQRELQFRNVQLILAKNCDLVAEFTSHAAILSNCVNRACGPRQLCNKQEPHAAPPAHRINKRRTRSGWCNEQDFQRIAFLLQRGFCCVC